MAPELRAPKFPSAKNVGQVVRLQTDVGYEFRNGPASDNSLVSDVVPFGFCFGVSYSTDCVCVAITSSTHDPSDRAGDPQEEPDEALHRGIIHLQADLRVVM